MALQKKIQVVVDASDAKKQLDILIKKMNGAELGTNRSSSATSRYAKSQRNLNSRIIGVNRSLSAMSGLLKKVASAATVFTGIRLADDFNELQNKLRITLTEGESLNKVQQKLIDTSLKTRSSLQGNALLYLRLSNSVDRAKVSQEELFRITESVNKAIQLGGSNAQEAQGALRQFTQIISSGFVTGYSQELNSIVEQTPGLFKLIVDGLRETSQEFRDLEASGLQGIKILKKFSEEGIGDLDVLLKAIASQAEDVDKQFRKVNITVAKSLGNLRTAIESYIGSVDDQYKITERLALAIDDVAQNFDSYIEKLSRFVVAGAAGVSTFVALKVAANAYTTAVFLANGGTKVLIATILRFGKFARVLNPITATITVIAIAVAAMAKKFIDANDGFVKFNGTVTKATTFLKGLLITIADYIFIVVDQVKIAFSSVVTYMKDLWVDFRNLFTSISNAGLESVKWIVEGFLDGFSLIGKAIGLFGAATVQTFITIGKNSAKALLEAIKGNVRSIDDLSSVLGENLFSGLFSEMFSEEVLMAANDDKLSTALGIFGDLVTTTIFAPLSGATDDFVTRLTRNLQMLAALKGAEDTFGEGDDNTPTDETISAWDRLIAKVREYQDTITAIGNATTAFTNLFGALSSIRQDKLDEELRTSTNMSEEERKAKEKQAKAAFEANKKYTLAGIALQTGLAIMTALADPTAGSWIIRAANAAAAAANGAAQYARANAQSYQAPTPPSGSSAAASQTTTEQTQYNEYTFHISGGDTASIKAMIQELFDSEKMQIKNGKVISV